MGYFYKSNVAVTKYGLLWSPLKHISPQKFKKSYHVPPAPLKR